MNTAGRWNGLHPADKRIRKIRIRHDQISLALAIDAQRLLVNLRSKPVVEKSGAAAKSDAATLQRRPHPTEARREVELPKYVILNFRCVSYAVLVLFLFIRLQFFYLFSLPHSDHFGSGWQGISFDSITVHLESDF